MRHTILAYFIVMSLSGCSYYPTFGDFLMDFFGPPYLPIIFVSQPPIQDFAQSIHQETAAMKITNQSGTPS